MKAPDLAAAPALLLQAIQASDGPLIAWDRAFLAQYRRETGGGMPGQEAVHLAFDQTERDEGERPDEPLPPPRTTEVPRPNRIREPVVLIDIPFKPDPETWRRVAQMRPDPPPKPPTPVPAVCPECTQRPVQVHVVAGTATAERFACWPCYYLPSASSHVVVQATECLDILAREGIQALADTEDRACGATETFPLAQHYLQRSVPVMRIVLDQAVAPLEARLAEAQQRIADLEAQLHRLTSPR